MDQENRLLPPFYGTMSSSIRADQLLRQLRPGSLNVHPPPLGAISILSSVNRIERVLDAIDRWRHRRRTSSIQLLTDRQLDDLGMTRADIGFSYTAIDRMLDRR